MTPNKMLDHIRAIHLHADGMDQDGAFAALQILNKHYPVMVAYIQTDPAWRRVAEETRELIRKLDAKK